MTRPHRRLGKGGREEGGEGEKGEDRLERWMEGWRGGGKEGGKAVPDTQDPHTEEECPICSTPGVGHLLKEEREGGRGRRERSSERRKEAGEGGREEGREGGRKPTSGSTKLLMTDPRREQERLIPKAKASSFP